MVYIPHKPEYHPTHEDSLKELVVVSKKDLYTDTLPVTNSLYLNLSPITWLVANYYIFSYQIVLSNVTLEGRQ